MPSQGSLSQRCSECRRCFKPAARSAHNQVTCGRAECRRKRRARLERRRRTTSLQDSRASERERQREHRRRRREQESATPPTCQVAEGSTAVKGGGEERVSLTGFEPNVPEIIEENSKNLDTVVEGLDEMSLAGFRVQLLEIIEKIARKVGIAEAKNPACHWPAEFFNHRE